MARKPCEECVMAELDNMGARCEECGKEYFRCEEHGGAAGAKRSLKSHMGLYHPKKGNR